MNIGDRVRLVHGREEGIITKVLPNNIVEVEIEDGFRIPVKRNEAVVISELEQKVFKAPVASTPTFEPQRSIYDRVGPTTSDVLSNKGVYMAFVPVNDRELSQYIINNTDWDLPFMLSVGTDPHHRGLASGILKPKTQQKVQHVLVPEFENWGTFTFQAFYYRPAFMQLKQPLIKSIKFRINTFFKNKQKAPILNQEAHLFQLDIEDSVNPVKIEPEKIVEKMFEKSSSTPTLVIPPKPAKVVDLHIEELTDDYLFMSNRQMLELQLSTFEKQFEAAIANGMDEIIFIHGVGNGVLRNELHKKLSGHKNVKYFEDSQKEKFGYGATKVKIK
ncbi:DUF2027 domain-containing protein [Cellulophaga sp. BC115SP]|uniref:Smr/MutS family protein n=1 Tax=Cellulophaga sp. BC115SP TaxID=2683263 RepID=UPI001412C337|nr:DUF2027 domain-containing protein [Cellulophaga sp. BC115SP]NBB26685.1 DUF2027 domain-containing protein [Cellulophaga sp. BC115SP]